MLDTQQTIQPLPSSFRDPSGFVFEKDGIIYRQVNKIFKEHFDLFLSTGCYDHLINHKWLIPHEEVDNNFSGASDWYKTLRPKKIPFISYSYEWSFDMMKDAALLTLQIAKEVIPFGMILKDATPYNIQWLDGRPIFIDSISFEKYDTSKPWIAYRQFCECFLSPLLLMYYSAQPLQTLLLAYPEGIPLAVTRSLLPWRSRFSFHTYLHIHLHERLSAKSAGKRQSPQAEFSQKKLLRLLDSLQSLVASLSWKDKTTTWANYYDEAGLRKNYLETKKNIVDQWVENLEVRTAIDLGANEGAFSFLLSGKTIRTIAADFDHTALNKLYRKIRKENNENILPVFIDVANPTPSIGLNNAERKSFLERVNVDLALALALVHHLAVGRNIPFEKMAEFFGKITNCLIIEFIPKQDDKVQFMLQQKKDIYHSYNEENFLAAFQEYFSILEKRLIAESNRTLFLMRRIRQSK